MSRIYGLAKDRQISGSSTEKNLYDDEDYYDYQDYHNYYDGSGNYLDGSGNYMDGSGQVVYESGSSMDENEEYADGNGDFFFSENTVKNHELGPVMISSGSEIPIPGMLMFFPLLLFLFLLLKKFTM